MGLGIYEAANENAIISDENPFTVTFDGRIGGAQAKKVYIRNDASDKWYSSIQLVVLDTIGASIVDGTVSGWSWKLMEKDIPPTEEEWAEVSPGNTISFSSSLGSSSLADTITYLSVWVRVEIPRGQSIQTITDIVLRLTAQENLI
jgi:hypothetical protein